MARDELPTIWKAEPHTLAKHQILSRYLKAWMPILTRSQAKKRSVGEVLFVDAFAGPGRYEGGEDGSPILALKAGLSHEPFPLPVRFIFIEADPRRHEQLAECIRLLRPRLADRPDLRVAPPHRGDCDEELRALISERGAHFGPALVFLDQFGYGSVSMDLISSIMSIEKCEVFSYFNGDAVRRFLSDRNKWPAITRGFGSDDWKEALSVPKSRVPSCLLSVYEKSLRNVGGCKYTRSFAMHGTGGKLLYWLIFATNNIKGMEEMKKAMATVDSSGGFYFSDANDPTQESIDSIIDGGAALADAIHREFEGRTVRVRDVHEFVIAQTTFHKYSDGLRLLEREQRLTAVDPPKRRRTGFSEYPDMKLYFSSISQGSLFP